MSGNSRADPDVIRAQARRISEWTEIGGVVDAIPDILLAVNAARQIVFANRAALDFFHAGEAAEIWGKRPGEGAGCMHSHESPGGCGTADACKVCGAFRAIQHGLQGGSPIEECRMAISGGNALDLRVWARPFDLDGHRFVFLSIKDISDEKRRQVLEKIFFHDLLNTAGGIQSISELLTGSAPEELLEFREIIASLSEQLVDEIQAQRDLSAAERGDLHVQMRRANSREAIAKVVLMYLKNQVCDGRTIRASETCDDVFFFSDLPVLLRVLGNLAKNALEATAQGGTVELGCQLLPGGLLEFFVHNAEFIPHDAQLQIFHRSFSTKGAGHGLGTYSAKLLTQRYLGGEVSFKSTPREGTKFFVRLPSGEIPEKGSPAPLRQLIGTGA